MRKLILWLMSSRFAANIQLRVLMHMTAKAFGVATPRVKGSAQELLAQYARFTAEEAERAIAAGYDMKALHQSLYNEAYAVGRLVRRLLRLQTYDDCMELLSVLYRNIGISLVGQLPGRLHISQCYFSRYYSPQVCGLISSLDWGIFAGVCAGGKLQFTRRITEGHGACCASFHI